MQVIGWNSNTNTPIELSDTPAYIVDSNTSGTVYTCWQSGSGVVIIQRDVTATNVKTTTFCNTSTWANRADVGNVWLPFDQLRGKAPYTPVYPTPVPFKS